MGELFATNALCKFLFLSFFFHPKGPDHPRAARSLPHGSLSNEILAGHAVCADGLLDDSEWLPFLLCWGGGGQSSC